MNEFTFNNPSFPIVIQESSIVTNGLVLQYDFYNAKSYCNGFSTVTDLSAARNNSQTITGSIVYQPTMRSMGFYADNSLGIIKTTFNPFVSMSATTQMTMCAWVSCSMYPSNGVYIARFVDTAASSGNYGTYLQWGSGYGITSSNKLSCGSTNAGVSQIDVKSTASYATGSWVYMAGTYSGSTVTLFINGVLTSTGSFSSGTANTQSMTIGGENYAGTYPYQLSGSIGSVQMYNRALKINEILQNFSASKRNYGY